MSIRLLAWGVLCAGCLACAGGCAARAQDGGSPPPNPQCGGIAGRPCAEGYSCVDDPNDDCDPAHGGRDCGGICVKQGEQPPASSCNDEDTTRRYISQDPQRCAAIRFFCETGEQPFFNDCGCGCERAP